MTWTRFALLVGLLLTSGMVGTQVRAQDARIRDVQVTQEGKRVIVQYDLLGLREATYDVDLRLSRNGGATFDYIPTATSGAIGSGISPGREKEIVWAALQDFPNGLKGQNFQFKVLARREGGGPRPKPTSQAEEGSSSQAGGDEDDAFNVKVGGGLSYNARQTIEVQFYDGYQVALAVESPAASLELRANYIKNTGTFSQAEVIDVDLLYNGGFYYLGGGAGIFNSSSEFFSFENNTVNLNGVAGIGFSIGWIYPYIEYRIPFSRGKRDDVLSGGLMLTL